MAKIGPVEARDSLQSVDMNRESNDILDKQTKDDVKKATDLNQMEKVKPETTAHKAGRIIAGILGGLLLAAGIAAATVAVTATFGVAVGVLGTVAAFAGITGSSIAAGAAGCAGIGLITTSALLAPKHAEVPAQPEVKQGSKFISQNDFSLLKNAVDAIDEENKVTFDAQTLDEIKEDLKDQKVNVKAKHVAAEDDVEFSNNTYFVITGNIKLENGQPPKVEKNLFNTSNYIDFVDKVLQKENINSAEITEKNVQLVRMYLSEAILDENILILHGDSKQAFSNPQFQKELAGELLSRIDDQATEERGKSLALFIAAITPVDFDAMKNAVPEENLGNNIIKA